MAADALTRLDIRKTTVAETLIELGVRMGVTIGGVESCKGPGAPLVGDFTLKQALDKASAGKGCAYAFVDARTVRFSAARAPTPAPRVAPSRPTITAAEPVAPLAPLVISAGKRSPRLGSLPGGVSVIGASQLQDTDASDTGSVARQTAGFITTNLGAGRNKILLRGLSDGTFTGRTQSTVGTYLDDVPVNYNAPDPDLRLLDVDRIEVLRGPQGALYGGGSLSGIYRIVTRQPELETYSASVGSAVAKTESGSNSYRLDAVVNAPIGQRSAVRIAAYHDVDGGYLDDVNLRLSNVDTTTRRGGRAAWRLDLGDWQIKVGTAVQNVTSKDTQYVTLAPTGPRRANQVRETHRNRLAENSVKITGSGDWGEFESVTGYVTHRYASRYDATLALTQFADPDQALELGLYDESARVRMASEDMIYTAPEIGRLRWMMGLFTATSIEEGDADLRARSGAITRSYYDEDRKDRLNEYALYGEATYDLGRGWKLAAGGRSFRTTVHTRSYVVAPYPGQTRDMDRKETFSGFSPKLSIQRDLAGGGMIYALTSEGYRAGGFNSGGLTAPSAARSVFRPDHLRNYEVGLTLNPWHGRVNLRTALFYDDWREIQTDQYFTSGLSYTANIGDGRNRGLEVEASWRATAHLTVSGNALFNQPEMTHIEPGFGIADTASLPGVPDVSFGSLVTYKHPLTAATSLMLTAETGYIGESRLTFDPRYSPSMGGYYTGKLSAQLVTDRWRAALFVSNPWNSSSDTFAYGNPFSFGQVRQVTPQRPRTWSLALSANF